MNKCTLFLLGQLSTRALSDFDVRGFVVEISYWLVINLVVRGHANNLLDNVLNFSKFNIFGQMALLMRDVMQKKAS